MRSRGWWAWPRLGPWVAPARQRGEEKGRGGGCPPTTSIFGGLEELWPEVLDKISGGVNLEK